MLIQLYPYTMLHGYFFGSSNILVVKSQFPSDLLMLMYCQFGFPEPR